MLNPDSQNKNIDTDEFLQGPYIPISYLHGFLNFLCDNRHAIEIITYNDLAWLDSENNWPEDYRKEYIRWKRSISNGKRDANKIYVLIQHDVDAQPIRTKQIILDELARGLHSNIMVFAKRINRKKLRDENILIPTIYPIATKLLKEISYRKNFVIGYHCNAVERAMYDLAEAKTLFRNDIIYLRQYFNIDFFSAHGGVPGPEGLNNHHIEVPEEFQASPRWIHNGRSPSFDGNYSDGGINNPCHDPSIFDLRNFIRSWRPGGRYRVLLHPQYYGETIKIAPGQKGAAWYEEVMCNPKNAWDSVCLQKPS